jgi:hemolysin activation/secretion protein
MAHKNHHHRQGTCFSVLGAFLIGTSLPGWGQQTPAPQLFQEQHRQQERERDLREQNERGADERVAYPPAMSNRLIPAAESPCFRIDSVRLVGESAESFQWVLSNLSGPLRDDSPLGRCIGTAGVSVVILRAQAELVARGWVTSQVLASAQDLSPGVLTMTLLPGRIKAIRLSPDSTEPLLGAAAFLTTAIPAHVGDILNLRDIEQGLENFKGAPTAEADIQIEPSKGPGSRPGDSDLVVKYVQPHKVRFSLTLDDSGIKTTGRYQAGATLSLDNPLGVNDLFYVNATHSVDGEIFHDSSRGTHAETAHYSVPYGDWLLGLTGSSSRYSQTVGGFNQNYLYAGENHNAEAALSRLIYRDQYRKISATVKAFRAETRNFVDDTEVGVQHRVVGGWEAGLAQKEYIGEATLDAAIGYKRGTGAFGSIEAPEEPFGEGTSRLKLYTLDASLTAPFKLDIGGSEQRFRYSAAIRGQWNKTPLTPLYRFAIGGRYTVRGFDGEVSLTGDRGVLFRNDIGWTLATSGAEAYIGADYGQVGGQSALVALGKHLAGGVLGIRGSFTNVSYDAFIGAPIYQPRGFETAHVASNFTVTASF